MLSRHPQPRQPLPPQAFPVLLYVPWAGRSHCFYETDAGNDSMCSWQLEKSKLLCKLFLKDKIEEGETSDEEVVSVFSAAVNWILFQEAVSPLSCILTWATPLLHVLVASQKETELILKWARCLADTVIVSCGSRGTKRDIAGSPNLEQQFIYMK